MYKTKDDLITYGEKMNDFEEFAELIKFKTAIGKRLQHARYDYEVKQRKDDPTEYYIEEYLIIKSDGYEYKINASGNSLLANEMQLIAVLCFKREIQGLLSKEEY